MFDQIYLTGFKRFGGHEINPTQEIVQHFSLKNIHNLTCTCLEVSNQPVEEYLRQVRTKVEQKANKKILNLHFGVGPNKVYFFQMFSYNNMNYRIPDNHGYQPKNFKITPQLQLDFIIGTSLNLQELKSTAPQKHQVTISSDPGRYLCNFIYYKSLCIAKTHNNVTSLFVHFPIHEFKSHQDNIQFVGWLLKKVLKGYENNHHHKQ